MSGLAEDFARLRITVTSPDKTVKAWLSLRHGFGIELPADAARRHTDASLATQVTAAIGGVMSGHTVAVDRMVLAAGRLVPGDRDARSEARLRYRRQVAGQCRDIEVKAVSPSKRVRMRMRGSGRLECEIKPGTLSSGELTPSQLAEDIVAVHDVVRARHRSEIRELTGPDALKVL